MKQESGASIRPTLRVLVRLILLLGILYLFFVSISSIGAAFKLAGKDYAKGLLTATNNPFLGLMIGLLVTSLVQSSSTTTSLIVGMVGGGVLTIPQAIPMVMGANIGTSVTNTLVSMGHITRKQEFRRAFAGATVHDFFNLLCVVIFLPLQITTNFLGRASAFLQTEFFHIGLDQKIGDPLKEGVKPAVKFLKETLLGITGDHKQLAAVLLLLLAFGLLFLSLKLIVETMKSLLIGQMESALNEKVFRHTAVSFVIGLVLTAIVQSSSISTSLIVPLVGAGLLTVRAIFPYTVGANIGTTITAILASFAVPEGRAAAMTVAFAHLMFNLSGTALFLPLKPIRNIPPWLAERLSDTVYERRYLAFVYIGAVFFLIPLAAMFLFGKLSG